MKLAIITLLVFSLGHLNLLSQSEIQLKVNDTLFPISMGSFHFSEDREAVISVTNLPTSFDELKKNAKSDELLNGSTEIEFLDNESIVFFKEIEYRDNKEYVIISFMKSGIAGMTYNVISGFPLDNEELYFPAVVKAVKSL